MDQPPPPLVDRALPVSAAAPINPSRVKPPCAFHPTVTSVQVCDNCRKATCAVCDFLFLGNIHVCPICVAAPPPKVSGSRAFLAIAGLSLSVVSMAMWGAFVTGTLGQFDAGTAGQIFVWAIMFPGFGAFALSVSALDRRLGNNLLLWIGAGLSSLFTAVLLTLIIIGNLSK